MGLNHRYLAFVGLSWSPRICIAKKFSGITDDGGLMNMLVKILPLKF